MYKIRLNTSHAGKRTGERLLNVFITSATTPPVRFRFFSIVAKPEVVVSMTHEAWHASSHVIGVASRYFAPFDVIAALRMRRRRTLRLFAGSDRSVSSRAGRWLPHDASRWPIDGAARRLGPTRIGPVRSDSKPFCGRPIY